MQRRCRQRKSRRACEASPGEQTIAEQPSTIEASAEAIEMQSRTLRNSIVSLAIFFALVAALLLGVPDLRSATEKLADASPGWVAAGVVLELLSCAGYVVLFGLVFGMLDRRLRSRLSLSELAVNSVVSVSGLA